MNDYLKTALGALSSVVFVGLLLYQPSMEPDVSTPTSMDRGNHGYAALHRWMDIENTPTRSLRTRISAESLANELSDDGNIMLVTLPLLKPMRRAEVLALKTWLARGNTLLLNAALNDTPTWMLTRSSERFIEQLEELIGFSFVPATDESNEQQVRNDITGTRFFNVTNNRHPLMRDVLKLIGLSDTVSTLWRPEPLGDESAIPSHLELAYDEEGGTPSLWMLREGQGLLIVSAWASLFSNTAMENPDNARLFRNILAYHRSPNGELIIDDFHQGVSELYDPDAFFSDRRLYASLAFLLGFWFLYLLGSTARLGPVSTPAEAATQLGLVRAFGNLMIRKLSGTDAARVLIENWLLAAGVKKESVLARDIPWTQLASSPLLEESTLAAVEASYRRAGQGKSVDLVELHQQLQNLRRTMS